MGMFDLYENPRFQAGSRKFRSVVGRIVCLFVGLYGMRNGYVNPNDLNDIGRIVSVVVGFVILSAAVAP